MKSFKSLFVELKKVSKRVVNVNDDVVIFEDVKWSDYYDNDDLRCSKLVDVIVEYDYMNRKVYDIILVKSKKVYGNNNMDKLFKEELLKYIGDDKKVLLSEFMNKFNNRSVFGLLYNFRGGRWSVNSFNDRFENWCRRSGLLVKEKINVYNRLWLVK
tara:strand:- start:173 stop:643 length:471 start_codon:yes stop_codon:yes gene_type:complete